MIVVFVLVGEGARIALNLATISLVTTMVCMWLVRLGFIRAAGSITVFLLWGVLSIAIYTFDGVDGTAVMGQLLIIFMVGLLINERWGTLLGLLTIGANYGAMVIQQRVGLPFPRAVDSLQSRWIVQGVYILIGVGLMQAAVRSIRSALSESQWNEQVLKDRVSDLRQAQAKLERNEKDLLGREAILKAVGSAAEQLFRGETLEASVPAMLEALGKATGADLVYVFENSHMADQPMLTSQRFEWVANGIEPQIDNPDLQDLDFRASGFGRWVELLSRNAMVRGQVNEFPHEEQGLLREQDISSILVVPIFSRTEWWVSWVLTRRNGNANGRRQSRMPCGRQRGSWVRPLSASAQSKRLIKVRRATGRLCGIRLTLFAGLSRMGKLHLPMKPSRNILGGTRKRWLAKTFGTQ